MIPNAVASTGPYAGLWSHLKSIDHALARSLNSAYSTELTALDKERLHALISLLRSGLSSSGSQPGYLVNLSSYLQDDEPEYAAACDLRDRIVTIDAFDNWKKPSKMSVDQKIQLLIKATEGFVTRKSLFTGDAPHAEFEVLRAVVQSLLSDAEAALQ